jgi:hypothetical protein
VIAAQGDGHADEDEKLIPAGAFVAGGDDPLSAAKTYTLDKFYIDTTPVTNAQYREFVKGTAHDPPFATALDPNNSESEVNLWPKGEYAPEIAHQPVVNVAWTDAQAFCVWKGKRLPTELEWEKAARGTDGRTFPWGNTAPTPQLARYGQQWRGLDTIRPVRSYPASVSPFGVLDMAGNVWQWTASVYSPTLAASGEAKIALWSKRDRVLRGGGWYSTKDSLKSSTRWFMSPTDAAVHVGFRCARSQSDPRVEYHDSSAKFIFTLPVGWKTEPVRSYEKRKHGQPFSLVQFFGYTVGNGAVVAIDVAVVDSEGDTAESFVDDYLKRPQSENRALAHQGEEGFFYTVDGPAPAISSHGSLRAGEQTGVFLVFDSPVIFTASRSGIPSTLDGRTEQVFVARGEDIVIFTLSSFKRDFRRDQTIFEAALALMTWD